MTPSEFVYQIKTHSALETQSVAAKLASQILSGDIIALTGNLASGKTTFTQGLTNYFHIDEYAASPTFTYMNEYHAGKYTLLHIDAYRLKSGAELESMGFWEFIEDGAIAIIEWADIVSEILPQGIINISFKADLIHPDLREIVITSPRELDLN